MVRVLTTNTDEDTKLLREIYRSKLTYAKRLLFFTKQPVPVVSKCSVRVSERIDITQQVASARLRVSYHQKNENQKSEPNLSKRTNEISLEIKLRI